MRKNITALVAVLVAVIGILGVSATTASATHVKWNPKASTPGEKFCKDGLTRQKVLFTNYHAKRRVQFNLRRTNDALAPYYTSFYVAPGKAVVKWIAVRHEQTVSLRVRSPEWKYPSRLMLSEVISAIPDCRKIVRAPRATLGGTSCIGRDSVVTVGLDNRATTDVPVEFQTIATQPGSVTTDVTTVPNRTLRNTYVVARSGADPVHIEVTDTETGRLLLSRDVPARSC